MIRPYSKFSSVKVMVWLLKSVANAFFLWLTISLGFYSAYEIDSISAYLHPYQSFELDRHQYNYRWHRCTRCMGFLYMDMLTEVLMVNSPLGN